MHFLRAFFTLPFASAVAPNLVLPNDRVLYSAIETLTLVSGELTASRRLPPVPQTQCASSPEWCKLADLSVLRCHKDGHSYDPESVQWLCEGRLPIEFDLGLVTIGCEGYDTADDAWVLRGSCGATYKLVLTQAGKEKYGGGKDGELSKGQKVVLILLGLAVVLFFLVAFLIQRRRDQRASEDQPPPYSENAEANRSRLSNGYGNRNPNYGIGDRDFSHGDLSHGDFNDGDNEHWHQHQHHQDQHHHQHHHHHHHHHEQPRRRSSSSESRPLLESHTSKGYGVTSNR